MNQGLGGSGLAISPTGLELLAKVNSRDAWLNTRFEAQRSRVYQSLMQRVHQEKITAYTDLGNTFQKSFASQTTVNSFDDSVLVEGENLSAKFQAIAKTIAMRNTFGIKRQTFFVSYGNFDGHTDLLVRQERLLKEVDLAMKNFWDEMCAQGLQKKVTVFTGSDFARTLRSNGACTDHAWGGHTLVVGGAVNGNATTGGKITGHYPTSLRLGQGLDTGTNGRLLPTTSIDSYYAELLRWFGVPENDLQSILPNIGNFSREPPLGIFTNAV